MKRTDITMLNVAPDKIKYQESENNTLKLMLNQGINCIRVNQTCDIFIKTTANMGTLLFDELCLVDCQPVEYIENGQVITKKTQGLNLNQLGYLEVPNTTTDSGTFNVFDAQIRKNLKKEYLDSALSAIDTQEQTALNIITTGLEKLQPIESDLQKLVDFLTVIKDEITTLKAKVGTNEATVAQLFAKYKELYLSVARETALYDVLLNSKDINVLEQQLLSRLDELKDVEITKQELLSQLDSLEQSVKAAENLFSASTLSKGDILDDFELTAKSDDLQLINDLKLASINEINTEYSNKLATVSKAVSALSDDAARNELLSLLEDLNATKHLEVIYQIEELLNASKTTISNFIDEALTEAAGNTATQEVDYQALYSKLVTIRTTVGTISIEELLAKIELLANSDLPNFDKYNDLVAFADKLNQILTNSLTESGETANSYSILNSLLGELLTIVQTKISAKEVAVDNTVLEKLNNLYTQASTVYITSLTDILTPLREALTALASDYSAKVSSLNTLKDTAITAILSNLNDYITTKNTQVSAVVNFGKADSFDISNAYLGLPYGVVAVLTVWPTYMKQDFIKGVDALYTGLYTAITGTDEALPSSLTLDSCFYTQKSPEQLRKVLVSIASLEAFQQLYEQIKELSSASAQALSRKSLINELSHITSGFFGTHEIVQEMMDSSDDKVALISQLITELVTSSENLTISKKQQLIKTIQSTLDEVIEVDSQLLEICAKLLCPSILNFTKAFPVAAKNAFYNKLADYIQTQLTDTETGLLSKIELGNSDYNSWIYRVLEKFDEISTYVIHPVHNELLTALTTKAIKSFNCWDSIEPVSDPDENDADKVRVLIPDEYLSILVTINSALKVQKQLTDIKSCSLLTILQDEKAVIAWQDTDYNWRDSSGGYYQRYSDGAWQASDYWLANDRKNMGARWTNNEGFWRTASGDLVKVTLKREYLGETDSSWKDTNGAAIVLRNNDGWLTSDGGLVIIDDKTKEGQQLIAILENLEANVHELGKFSIIPESARTAYSIWCLEEQLLAEIRELDREHSFYYNVPVESHVAINFNEGDSKLNTLMNPAINYDINNVNNNFVISKLDINYINTGVQVARSSKIN